MRLLLDENIEPVFERWLISEGHDVSHVAKLMPATDDVSVAARAGKDDRVVITSDADFGELTVRRNIRFVGIIFLRLGQASAPAKLDRLREAWFVASSNVYGHVVVVDWRRVRFRPLVTRA